MKESCIDDVPTDFGKVGPLKDCYGGIHPPYEKLTCKQKTSICHVHCLAFEGCRTKVWSSMLLKTCTKSKKYLGDTCKGVCGPCKEKCKGKKECKCGKCQ